MPTLRWLSRDDDIRTAESIPYRLFEEVPDLGYGDRDTGNMIVQGDNLHALKALLPFYAGQVQCVYVDPPFNTGQAFEHYDDNLEHSIWLGLMYSRLYYLRELLNETGTIAIHLDVEEIAYCTVLMDEIFGRKNRVGMCTFKQSSVSGPKSINPGLVSICSYVLIYSKNKSRWKSHKVYRARGRDERYSTFIENVDQPLAERTTIPLTRAIERHFGEPVKELKKKFNINYESKIHDFVVSNARSVVRTARVKEKDIAEEARAALKASEKNHSRFYSFDRPGQTAQYFYKGEQVATYETKVREIDGVRVTAERVSELWDDLLSNNLHKEGGVSFPKGKKPEALIKRVFDMFTDTGDLVLDSFLGSGTTAAVAHKMGRKYIGVEIGDHARTLCQPRLVRVVDGDQTGISKAVNWKGGGGFRFYQLGLPAFDETGQIRPDIEFSVLAAHVWFSEVRSPWSRSALPSPVLGVHQGRAYALLYNGILGDKSVSGGNVLTRKTLAVIRNALGGEFSGPTTVYGERSALSDASLAREQVTFKQTPYDVKARV